MPVEPDATEVEATEIGTAAASPKALAEAAQGSHDTTRVAESRLSGWATASHRPAATAAEALDNSELPRMRVFAMFGITASVVASALTFAIGGDTLARELFWAGISLLALTNVWLVWLTGSIERYRPGPIAAVWIASSVGIIPSMYYFGPFSAVVIAPMLGVVFIALGRDRATSLIVTSILIVGHLALAIPITLGWIADRGVLPAIITTQVQLVLAEGLIVTMLFSAYVLGRWARKTNKAALDELASALRVIGDQQQQLAEVDAEAAAARRAKEGRWTNHVMGGFKLGLVLGRGAMGEVYEGFTAAGSPVAVKLLAQASLSNPNHVMRFLRELRTAIGLDSPNVVRVIEVGERPVPYLVMEKLDGKNLGDIMKQRRVLPGPEVVDLIRQVGVGITAAAAAGVVHRDIKPQNLFFAKGTWKILDFGVARAIDSGDTLTNGQIVGTPSYMAPEQASGGTVDHVTDLYALAAVAYRALTGHPPFASGEIAETLYRVVHTAPARPSTLVDVPPEIDLVLAIGLAKKPRDRFTSALDLAEALADAFAGTLPISLRERGEQLERNGAWKIPGTRRTRAATSRLK